MSSIDSFNRHPEQPSHEKLIDAAVSDNPHYVALRPDLVQLVRKALPECTEKQLNRLLQDPFWQVRILTWVKIEPKAYPPSLVKHVKNWELSAHLGGIQDDSAEFLHDKFHAISKVMARIGHALRHFVIGPNAQEKRQEERMQANKEANLDGLMVEALDPELRKTGGTALERRIIKAFPAFSDAQKHELYEDEGWRVIIERHWLNFDNPTRAKIDTIRRALETSKDNNNPAS